LSRLAGTTVGSDFVARLADRAAEAEKLRRLPGATVDDYRESGLARLLLPARYGGRQAEFPEIFDVVRRMAHGPNVQCLDVGVLHPA
jgi:alkylation response protein AidB-like acyl-CoA dehydrogenase